MGPWTHGTLGPWAHGLMGPRAHGPKALGPWALGPLFLGPWALGPLSGPGPWAHYMGVSGPYLSGVGPSLFIRCGAIPIYMGEGGIVYYPRRRLI